MTKGKDQHCLRNIAASGLCRSVPARFVTHR